MSRESINIGLVIADIDEYVHVKEKLGDGAVEADICGLMGHCIKIKGEKSDIFLHTLCVGVGKVFAASGGTLLADESDILVNAGLSGGLGGAVRHGMVVGTEFFEHDVDFTPLGYKPGEKPSFDNVIKADEELINDITKKYPFIEKGAFVTGDSFICSDAKKKELVERYGAVACDMESAAVAYAARLAGVPFLSIRMISDDAGDNANGKYRDTLLGEHGGDWMAVVFDWIKSL